MNAQLNVSEGEGQVRDLLVEIGTEELPARFVDSGSEQLAQQLAAGLDQQGVSHGDLRRLATPRRLAVLVREVATLQKEQVIEKRGPSRQAGLTAEGTPTQAAIGFAKANGVPVESLEVRSTPQGEYLFAVRRQPGRPTAEVLPEIVKTAIAAIAFPRTMRWGDLTERFARPVRWLVVLFGSDVIPVTSKGVSSGRATYGHRQLGPGPWALSQPADYENVLYQVGVVADPERRRQQLLSQVNQAAAAAGGQAVLAPGLVAEVTNLVEWPTAFVGHFDPAFLELPEPVLITPMQHHQRYFPVRDANGRLLPLFVGVRNGGTEGLAGVAAGNERVLQARLEDARFYFTQDLDKPLGAYSEALEGIVFQEQLGTMAAKVRRIVALTEWVGRQLLLPDDVLATGRRAAQLCKNDLATRVVSEFDELQGVIGREYARRAGEPEAVAVAIGEQYLPRGAADALPATPAGALLSVSDRIDTLAGYFSIGMVPSGSQDPYALRRQALGLLRILLERGWHLDLRQTLERALEQYPPRQGAPAVSQVAEEIWRFVADRERALLIEQGLRYDLVDAALLAAGADPVGAAARAHALHATAAHGEFDDLAVAYGRAFHILRQAQFTASDRTEQELRARWDALAAERAADHPGAEAELLEATLRVAGRVEAYARQERWQEAIVELSGLRQAIDRFFTEVLVMDPDPQVRRYRLQLLDFFVRVAGRVAAWEKVVPAGQA
ncbi:MAG: glycine--tRNA ligase subunit beta [Limnochordaceae bacterium]|nr:glycine--tRNA ligase subunit beta [Limnochordaceae bacterium]